MADLDDPYEVLKKGYLRTLRGIWRRQWARRGAKALPRLLVGSFLFTLGYALMRGHQSVEELKAWWEERRKKSEAVGKEMEIEKDLIKVS